MNDPKESHVLTIKREAKERYILDLVRCFAAEQERIAEAKGEPLGTEILEVQLEGEYPNTGLRFRTYDRKRNLLHDTWSPIWSSSTFFKDGKQEYTSEEIASEILMHRRGG